MSGFDLDAYNEQARNGPCFICSMPAGAPGYEHRIVLDDPGRSGRLAARLRPVAGEGTGAQGRSVSASTQSR
ncbi:hypothetical protein ACFQ6N_00830 [Kitasatospora sp. NPDC056446]|uniref:hypothetical protein n=1 Tax=Kitasatospora sp. NPDC056446 TaxID=3345819 RepID=UPI00369BB28A